MWRIETRSGHTLYPVAVASLLAVMAGLWPSIPAGWQKPALAWAVVVLAPSGVYFLLDVLALLWEARQYAEPDPDPIAPSQDSRDGVLGPNVATSPLNPILVHEGPTTRTIPRISASVEAIALLNKGMSLLGERSLRLPGWREMKPEWDYPRWSLAVRSLGPYLAPTSGGVNGGGTFVMSFNSLRELYDAVVDGRVKPTYPESGQPEGVE